MVQYYFKQVEPNGIKFHTKEMAITKTNYISTPKKEKNTDEGKSTREREWKKMKGEMKILDGGGS